MHIIAYIYLLIKRSLSLFAQFYIAGTAKMFPVKKLGKEKYITSCKAYSASHLRFDISRQNSPFRCGFLPQIKYFNSSRYWHCKTDYYWQIPRIIRCHLSRLTQAPERLSPVANIARCPGFKYQRLLVDTSNCPPTLFNFLTPHMRYPSSSHTDVAVLKTQPSKERIKQ